MFSPSAAVSLTEALSTKGREEEVLALVDDLVWGPLDPTERASWRELDDFVARDEAFWQRVASVRTDIVAWMSRRSATEYCGFLELLRRIEAPIRVVDVADIDLGNPITSMCFGFVGERQIVTNRLDEGAVTISPTRRQTLRMVWEALRTENAPLRILTATGFASAPVDYFDETILSYVTNDWQRCTRIVGDAQANTDLDGCLQGGGASFLFSRILDLIDAGVLEGDEVRVRRPSVS